MMYLNSDLLFELNSSESSFDFQLKNSWQIACNSGTTNYMPKDILPMKRKNVGSLEIRLLVHPDRFSYRRKPPLFKILNHEYESKAFNFTKIKDNEILFKLEFEGLSDIAYIIINANPFMPNHSIIVPEPHSAYNQVLRKSSLIMALNTLLISSDRYLCLGFNSLLAYASVNHLHFHLWQTTEPLHCAICVRFLVGFYCSQPVTPKTIMKPFLEIRDHPISNFVIEIKSQQGYHEGLKHLWSLIDVCQRLEVAHNLFAARNADGQVRVVVWPRRSVYEKKSISVEDSCVCEGEPVGRGFNVAVAELAGMVVVGCEAVANRLLQNDNLQQIYRQEQLPEEIQHLLNESL